MEFQINNPSNYEVLATVGKIKGKNSKIFFLTCYAPPNMGSLAAGGLLEFISDLTAEAKRVLEDPLIVVSGNFNQWPIQDILGDHPDMPEVDHGPTRLGRSIDRSFVNFSRSIKASGTSTPLETEDGMQSDHRVAYMEVAFPKKKTNKTTYTYRAFTPEGAELFQQRLAEVQWDNVCNTESPDAGAGSLQTVLDGLMDECFIWRTTTGGTG